MSATSALLWAWLMAASGMGLVWLAQLRFSSAGIVDVVWAVATPLLAWWLMWATSEMLDGRAILLGVLLSAWGARLAWHLSSRLGRQGEDGRYVAMEEALGRYAQLGMLGFFQVQALWALMFALPVWAAGGAARPFPDWLDVLGVVVWVGALAGESMADSQLAAFKAKAANDGKVCDRGLWRYSRHPNYFFEWLHWFAYPLIGFGAAYWWLTVAGVVVMYLFLTRVTGVPHTERQSLRSRGEAYRAYQRRTSAFFPLPPRDEPAESKEQA